MLAGQSASRIGLDYGLGLGASTGAAFARAPASPADPQPSSIVLIADPISTFADGIAAELADQYPNIDRVVSGYEVENPAAAVVVVERDAEIPALRGLLERTSTPTLVMAATRRLAEAILPLLGNIHDLATAADSPDILRWRLQRLLQQARTPLLAIAELDALTGLLSGGAEAPEQSSRDLDLAHFENVTRVATEQLVEMITSKSRRLVDAAKQEANLCPLTGLYSRRYVETQLPRDIERARAQRRPLSLALIDIDHFHMVNMTHGWPTGDRVLQTFATVVQANVRATDWVARYGGEEFLIVLPNTTLDSARFIIERVRHAFASAEIVGLEGEAVAATLSAGVTQRADETASAVAFVNEASKALLEAKRTGRNRVVLTE